MLNVLPRDDKYFDQFNELAVRIHESARILARFFDGESPVGSVADQIKRLEHECDEISHQILRGIDRSFITPIDRDHILQLVNAMDDICDLIQDTAETLTLYDIRAVTPEAARLADIGMKCCERVKDVVELLGTRDGKFEAILKTCDEIDRLESDADRVMRSAVSRLFREEQDVRELIKMKAIYELLEAITDRCLDVANLAEGISLENS